MPLSLIQGQFLSTFSAHHKLHIYQRQARWHLESLDRDRHAKRLFRVDHITQLVTDDAAEPLTKQTIAEWTRDVASNVDLTLDTPPFNASAGGTSLVADYSFWIRINNGRGYRIRLTLRIQMPW